MKNATRIPAMVMSNTVMEMRNHLKSLSEYNAKEDAMMLKNGVNTRIATPALRNTEPTELLNNEMNNPIDITTIETYTPYLRTRPVALSKSIQSTPMSSRRTDVADATRTIEKYFLMELVSKCAETRVPTNIPRKEPMATRTA